MLETNQWLIHSWGLVGPELFLLGRLLAGSCPEECIGACLWKAEAMTSSSLTVTQSGNCLSLKKRGMEQECRKKSITLFFSAMRSCASFFFGLCPSLSISFSCSNSTFYYSVFLFPSLYTSPLPFSACPLQGFDQDKEQTPDSRQPDFPQSHVGNSAYQTKLENTPSGLIQKGQSWGASQRCSSRRSVGVMVNFIPNLSFSSDSESKGQKYN